MGLKQMKVRGRMRFSRVYDRKMRRVREKIDELSQNRSAVRVGLLVGRGSKRNIKEDACQSVKPKERKNKTKRQKRGSDNRA